MPLIRKNRKKNEGASAVPGYGSAGFRLFSKVWAIVYLICLLAFELMVIMLDILPSKYLLMSFAVLGTLSILIFYMLAGRKPKKGLREAAVVLAALLIFVYGAGMYYIYATLNFLGFVSTDMRGGRNIMDEAFNVYVSGIDRWDDITYVGRSDVNMLLTINPETHKMLITSIPRDYKIRLTDRDNATDKITHTGIYGIETTVSSVEDLLDVKIDYYIRVNFSTLVQLVDALGGIDVVADEEFTSRYGGDYNNYSFKKGSNHLNGRQALAFARERKSLLFGDRARIQNQQRVVEAVIAKATGDFSTMLRYKALLDSIRNYMETDLSSAQIRALVKDQLFGEERWSVDKVALTGSDGNEATYSGSASYIMLPDKRSVDAAKDKIKAVVDAVPQGSDS